MTYEKISLDFDGATAVLAFSDPAAMNAVSLAMLRELRDAMGRIENPANGARCLLITGNGRGFCAGANLADGERQSAGPMDTGAVLEEWYHPLLLRLRELKMPIVTAVNGAAAGVGMSFALMGDMILMAKSAYFLQAFRRIGLIPDGGSTWLLPRLIGRARAMELSLMGEKLPADRALDWGLINRVYDDEALLPEARKLAAELASGPTVALSLIRRAYWDGLDNSYETQLHNEAVMQRQAGRTSDFAEGVSAFLGKRPAQFKGQ